MREAGVCVDVSRRDLLRSARSVKHLALALLRDELIKISHHLVAPGNQRLDLVLRRLLGPQREFCSR